MKTLNIIGLILIALSGTSLAETLTHNNSYHNIKPGHSTLSDVIETFGPPLDKKSNSNNIIYYYPNFWVTIQDKTGKVNTIIVISDDYTDENGVYVGLSQKYVEAKMSKKARRNTLSDMENGIIYWFSESKVSKIVLTYKTRDGRPKR